MKHCKVQKLVKIDSGILNVDESGYENPNTPLTLAFVGDNVYDLVVRTLLFEEGNRKLNDIHKKKSNLVKAETQAWIAEYLSETELFTEEEADYYRKGKNAKTLSHAKNAGFPEYHKATGLGVRDGVFVSYRSGRTCCRVM